MADPSFARMLQQIARRLGSAGLTLVKAEATAAWKHVVEGTLTGRARKAVASSPSQPAGGDRLGGSRAREEPPGSVLVDLNAASEAELQTLPGIGPARAQAIVAARPYASEEELIERAVIPASVFDAVEGQICVGRGAALPKRPEGSRSSPHA